MDFKFLNRGKEETKQFNSVQDVINSSLLSEQVRTQLKNLRKIHGTHGKAKAYITVIKNEGRKDEQILCKTNPNQLQNDGRDAMHDALWVDTSATQVGFNFMAVSDNVAGLPADSANTMLGEITTGGLIRVGADTKTHSVGTATTLVENTYTATATHTAVQKGALFDAVTTGVMGIIYLFTSATLVNNDTLKVSVTITLND